MPDLILPPSFAPSRRQFIKLIGAGATCIATPGIAQIIQPAHPQYPQPTQPVTPTQPTPQQQNQTQTWQSDPLFWQRPRSLWLKRQSNGEQIKVIYYAEGQILSDGYNAACHLLRDVQANQTIAIDPVLLDVLCGIQGWFALAGIFLPIIILSGYRTHGTNSKTESAAKNSMHLYGRAADIIVEGIPIEYLQKLALYLRGGGVGIYFGKGFIHVDTGRLRAWRG